MTEKPYLSWIDDSELENAVTHVYQQLITGLTKKNLKNFTKNQIDPFSLVFEMYSSNISPIEWLHNEVQRQAQKTMTNAIGDFHELVLGACDGWINLPTGHESSVDLMKEDGSIFAELKNKHNTMKGDSKLPFLEKYIALANRKPDSTIYLVHIIHKGTAQVYGNNTGKVWKVNDKSHERVKLIRGVDFYNLVTGHTGALEELYQILPHVLQKVMSANPLQIQNTPLITQLQESLEIDISDEKADKVILDYFFNLTFGKFLE